MTSVNTRRIALFLGMLLLLTASAGGCARKISGNDRLGPPWNANIPDRESAWSEEKLPVAPLPPADKTLTFDDCILTAAFHAPDMAESLIGLELTQMDSESAYSKRFPSVQSFFRVIANTTRQHREYEDTSFRLGFVVYGFEPVASYFTHKASLLMEEIALLTHKTALEKKAGQIGEAVLSLQSRQKLRDLQKARLEQAKQFSAYQKAKEGPAPNPLEQAKAAHFEKRIAAELEKTEASASSLLLSLKVMTGLDLDRKLNIDPTSLNKMLDADSASAVLTKHSWESVWQASPESAMFKLALKLRDYDILLSWTRYLPSMSMDVYAANPTSDYATYSTKDDIFLNITFTLPLLDWGERERGLQGSRLRKLQEQQRARAARTAFAAGWQAGWNEYRMAAGSYEAARNKVAALALDEQRAELQYRSGQIDFSVVDNIRTRLYEEELAMLEAETQLKLREFSNWLLSGNFRRRYFEDTGGDAAKAPL
jgi:outer membrane protein TolC